MPATAPPSYEDAALEAYALLTEMEEQLAADRQGLMRLLSSSRAAIEESRKLLARVPSIDVS